MGGVIDVAGRFARRQPAFRYKSTLLRRVAKASGVMGIGTVIPVEMANGTRIVLDARSRTEAGAFWNGTYDDDDVDFLVACFGPESVMVDVGANVGLIALQVANAIVATPMGRQILAVEPMPVNYAHLSTSLDLVDQYRLLVRPVSLALGEDEGFLDLNGESKGSSNAGLAEAGFRGADAVSTRRTSLDQLLIEQGIGNVGLIKIDAEGYDSHVIAGAVDCLTRMRPIVYGEFNNELMPRLGRSFDDVVRVMRPLDYRFFAFRGRLDLIELTSPPRDAGNMAIIPEERVVEVADKMAVRLVRR